MRPLRFFWSERLILSGLAARNRDRFTVPSWCAENSYITFSDAKDLSEFRADSSNSTPILCAAALRLR